MFSKRFTKALEDWYGSNWMLSDAWELAKEQGGFKSLTRTDLLEFNRLIGTRGRHKISNEGLALRLLCEPESTPYWVQFQALRQAQLNCDPGSKEWELLSDKLLDTLTEAKANLTEYEYNNLEWESYYEQTQRHCRVFVATP